MVAQVECTAKACGIWGGRPGYAGSRMAIDPIELTRRLVNIESTTYHEGLAAAFVAEFLGEQGWDVERMRVEQPDLQQTPGGGTAERFNVYAAMHGVTPDVVLSTHMDTVPPYFGCTEDDEFLYGRGTCDAKGILAAQVAAAERLRDAGVKVGLLFVVGEERDSAGAKVANQNPRGSRFLINGEPTDNRLALATKGALRVELRAHGRMAHSAYPELGDSAINKLVESLDDLLKMSLPIEPEIGSSTLNIGLISGGRAPNVIADQAEAHLLIRTVGPSQEIMEEIRRVVAGRCEVSSSLDLAFVRMRRVGSLPTMIAKFATDIPSLTNWGEPFLLGPGSIHVAHTPDEKISKRELLECVDLYVELATSLVS
jgi:acetylornithine deacetylase